MMHFLSTKRGKADLEMKYIVLPMSPKVHIRFREKIATNCLHKKNCIARANGLSTDTAQDFPPSLFI